MKKYTPSLADLDGCEACEDNPHGLCTACHNAQFPETYVCEKCDSPIDDCFCREWKEEGFFFPSLS